jgi:hypothetical protein
MNRLHKLFLSASKLVPQQLEEEAKTFMKHLDGQELQ